MKAYGNKIKSGCSCCNDYKNKNTGKTPKKRARHKAKLVIKNEIKKLKR
jgi:hypothetical protein